MSSHQTPDEVKGECIRTMGADLGALYYDLHQGLSWLYLKWQQHRGLFGVNEDQVTLLNRTAPAFFGVVQRTLVDDILLHVARLTDPVLSMGSKDKENVSLHGLPEFIHDPDFKAEVEKRLESIDARCTFARDHRNRRLAHTDLQTYRRARPLPAATRHDLDAALEEITALLQRFSQHYQGADMAYGFIQEHGGADSLVFYLDLGLKASKHRPDA